MDFRDRLITGAVNAITMLALAAILLVIVAVDIFSGRKK